MRGNCINDFGEEMLEAMPSETAGWLERCPFPCARYWRSPVGLMALNCACWRIEPLARLRTLCENRVLSLYCTRVHIVLLVEMRAATVGSLELCVRTEFLSMYRAHCTTSEDESGNFWRVEPLSRSSTLCENRVLSLYRTRVHVVLLVEMRAAPVARARTEFYQIRLLVCSLVYKMAMPVGSLR